MEIAVVDYGMGNLRSVEKALARTGASIVVTSDAGVIERAHGVVLPGVGAFAACMENLESRQLTAPVRDAARSGRPFLGICLGLQLLFEQSAEFGTVPGLGVLRGRVQEFGRDLRDASGHRLKVPHMGWNRIRIDKPTPEFEGIEDGSHFYFVHSYYVVPTDPGVAAATTTYGDPFTSAVSDGAIFASQFHPEKSQEVGLRVLENFVQRVRST